MQYAYEELRLRIELNGAIEEGLGGILWATIGRNQPENSRKSMEKQWKSHRHRGRVRPPGGLLHVLEAAVVSDVHTDQVDARASSGGDGGIEIGGWRRAATTNRKSSLRKCPQIIKPGGGGRWCACWLPAAGCGRPHGLLLCVPHAARLGHTTGWAVPSIRSCATPLRCSTASRGPDQCEPDDGSDCCCAPAVAAAKRPRQ